jgi:hypothetical protein
MKKIRTDITPYAYFSSAVGNAYFSGIGLDMLWECVANSSSPKEFDEVVQSVVTAKDDLNAMLGGNK